MSSYDKGAHAKYNSLNDRHLMGFFSNDRMRNHLVKSGLITKKGDVVPDATYRVKMARRVHRRRVRDLLAHAIVHKSLEAERSRQIDIRKKIGEIAKAELMHRVRNDRGKSAGEKNDNDIEESSRSRKSTARSAASQDEPKTAKDTPRQRLEKIMPNEEMDSKHLSLLDSWTLNDYAKIIENQNREKNNKLPQLRNNSDDIRRNPKPPKDLRRSKSGTRQKQDDSQNSSHSQPVLYLQPKDPKRATVSILFHAPSNNRSFEVLVEQQHNGGNTLILHKDSISNNDVFQLISHRHQGFPFSLSFYIDNVKDSRISTCCEYKHKVGKRLGGPKAHFTLQGVEGSKPCFRCLADRDLANDTMEHKSKSAKSDTRKISLHETHSVPSTSTDQNKLEDDFESDRSSLKEVSDNNEGKNPSPHHSHSSSRKNSVETVTIAVIVTDKRNHDRDQAAVIEPNDEYKTEGENISPRGSNTSIKTMTPHNEEVIRPVMDQKGHDDDQAANIAVNDECIPQGNNMPRSSPGENSQENDVIVVYTIDQKGDDSDQAAEILINNEYIIQDSVERPSSTNNAVEIERPNSNNEIPRSNDVSKVNSSEGRKIFNSERDSINLMNSEAINNTDEPVTSYPPPNVEHRNHESDRPNVVLIPNNRPHTVTDISNDFNIHSDSSSSYGSESEWEKVLEVTRSGTIINDHRLSINEDNNGNSVHSHQLEQASFVPSNEALGGELNDLTSSSMTSGTYTENSDEDDFLEEVDTELKDLEYTNEEESKTTVIETRPEITGDNFIDYDTHFQNTSLNNENNEKENLLPEVAGDIIVAQNNEQKDELVIVETPISNSGEHHLEKDNEESLKIVIPNDEDDNVSPNLDETDIDEPRNGYNSFTNLEINRQNNSIAKRPNSKESEESDGEHTARMRQRSSFTSSTLSVTDTESDASLRLEHQSEQRNTISDKEDTKEETMTEDFDISFLNDDITFKKAKEIFEQVGDRRVSSLTIRNCELPSHIFNFIANELQSKKDLRRIEMSGCEVEISLLKLLARSLEKWPLLDTLIISHNTFVDYSLYDIVNTIGYLYNKDKTIAMSTLKLFDLSSCCLRENDFGQIIKLIADNACIEQIVMDHNPIDRKLWQDLKNALMSNSNTKSISINGCVTDMELLTEIDAEIRQEDISRLILS